MTTREQIYYTFMPSPVGKFLVAGTERVLHRTAFSESEQFTLEADWIEDAAPLKYATDQLEAYFEGKLTEFDVELAMMGSEFQVAVWQALMDVPYGKTASYGDIAHALGKPGASRAVGGANNSNHIPIVIPCHRIIGADGSMTGFGGGMENKKILLKLEGISVPSEQLDLF
ncbi:MAG: methylated-DNA--[protein]-cysteine S-methyltransferase [OCS116 cluster bacterium]|uniref:Methylated-DNA--protein-cysteine methyltransferase n=1 Tax=OCS116 cluster bacterium TaxID=2030921 RepID=A0A2A4YQZ1_9PROT|nr:methylated-DNA--[protein]-cysteine S-methyltransferase [OCS116 cluster bacterium]